MDPLKRIQNKLDLLAADKLREVASKLYEELEETKLQLNYMEESADFWREQVFSLQEQLDDGQQLGMLKSGELLIVNRVN